MLALIGALAGVGVIVGAFLPWWQLPAEQVFGLGIPGYEAAGIERWHGWAAGAAGISLVILDGSVGVRPLETRGVALFAAVAGASALAVAILSLLAEGAALRPGLGAFLSGGFGLLGGVASAFAARRPRERERAWTRRVRS